MTFILLTTPIDIDVRVNLSAITIIVFIPVRWRDPVQFLKVGGALYVWPLEIHSPPFIGQFKIKFWLMSRRRRR